MGATKLVWDEELEYNFCLVAIHSSLENYKVVFLLNKLLNLKLQRNKEDLVVNTEKGNVSHAIYTYEDVYKSCTYSAIENKASVNVTQEIQGLFGAQLFEKETSLFVRDLPNVDFLLKVSDMASTVEKDNLIKHIKSIPQFVAAYYLDLSKLKNKENLIFE